MMAIRMMSSILLEEAIRMHFTDLWLQEHN